jgi:phage recombination protein Bet
MSNVPVVVQREFNESEVSLIRETVAKGATPDEFRLFLYRCQHMGLDPLKPGQIHFVKYGSSPGTIIVGIEGFRSRAAKTGKHSGTKRGVLRDSCGNCIGAWCEVYRSDWTQPAREEVSLQEYNTNKAQWAKMPETMIKKVAECAALRMAFPDELGGVYERAEMDQAESGVIEVPPEKPADKQPAQIEGLAKPSDERTLEISELATKFRKIGVSESMICDKYKLKDLGELTENHIAELNHIGSQIVNGKGRVGDFFQTKKRSA